MFKLKPHKSLVKFTVPVQRATIRKVVLPNMQVRMYKVPHLQLDAPGVDEIDSLHFHQITIKLRFWTERFFRLPASTVHSHFENTFRYQLKKFAIEVGYNFDYFVFDLKMALESKPHNVKTHIPRKRVRSRRKQLKKTYKFDILPIDVKISLPDPFPMHGTKEAPGALKFGPVLSTSPVELQAPKITPQAASFERLQKPAGEAIAAPFSSIQVKRIHRTADFGYLAEPMAHAFSTVNTPKIHHIDLHSLSQSALGSKNMQALPDKAQQQIAKQHPPAEPAAQQVEQNPSSSQ